MAGYAQNLSVWNVRQQDRELTTVLGCIGTVSLSVHMTPCLQKTLMTEIEKEPGVQDFPHSDLSALVSAGEDGATQQ